MLSSSTFPISPIMISTGKDFYVQLGRRVAEARKAAGITRCSSPKPWASPSRR